MIGAPLGDGKSRPYRTSRNADQLSTPEGLITNFSNAPHGVIVAAVAITLLGNRQAKAADPYPYAMAACHEAAISTEDPTDYKCDWKKGVDGLPGPAVTGKFSFREEAMFGEMTILEPGDGPADIGFSTVTKRNDVPTCSAGLGGSRNDNDELVATMDDPESCELRVVSFPGLCFGRLANRNPPMMAEI